VSKDVPVVVPIAAVEQHGRHLPVFTDSMLLGEVVRRAAEPLQDRVVWAPLLWLGNSHHHLDFPGTLSAAPDVSRPSGRPDRTTWSYFRVSPGRAANGHGEHRRVSRQSSEARQRTGSGRLAAPGVDVLAPGASPTRSIRRSCGIGWTRLRVGDLDDLAPGAPTGRRPEQHRAGPAGASRSSRPRALAHQERSTVGHIGGPRRATAEKAQTLFRIFSQDVVTFLERVIAWDGRSWERNEMDSATTAIAERDASGLGICGLLLLATMLSVHGPAERHRAKQRARSSRAETEQPGLRPSSSSVSGWHSPWGIVTGSSPTGSARWLYPAVLTGWSTVGFATGWVTSC
jgi:creatinine amidohydrolase